MKKYFEVILVVGVIFLLTTVVFIPTTNADWSMYRSNSSRSGVGTGNIGLSPAILWRSNITWEQLQTPIDSEEHIWTAPAIVDGIVYVGASSIVKTNNYHTVLMWDDVYALNATNGAVFWNYRINSSESISPSAVDHGVVYVGVSNMVYALNASNGDLIWNSIQGIGSGYSSPAAVDGVVYTGGYNGNLYALNASDGEIVWNSTVGEDVAASSPAVVNGVVYIGSATNLVQPINHEYFPGDIYALSAKNGSRLWESNNIGWVQASPAVANNVVYVSAPDGNLYALDAATGNRLWNFSTLAGRGDSPPAVANGLVYFDSYDGHDYALNESSGKEVWSFTVGTGTGSPPVVADGVVITVRPSGIYGLNPQDGALIWNYSNSNGIFGSEPAVNNGVLYLGGSGAQFYALGNPISLSLSPSSTPSPSIPEFPQLTTLLPLLMITIFTLVFTAKKKHDAEIKHENKEKG